MKFNMDFNFPYAHVVLREVDEETMMEYSRHMEYETPFRVTEPVRESAWPAQGKPKTYIINPNLVTYVEIEETKTL